MEDDKLYSFVAAAKKLGIHRDTLSKEFDKGKIKGHLRGKRTKFSQADIDDYKENQRIDKSQEASGFGFEECKHLKEVPV